MQFNVLGSDVRKRYDLAMEKAFNDPEFLEMQRHIRESELSGPSYHSGNILRFRF